MAFAPGYSDDEAQLLISLAAFAYVDETPLQGETPAQQTARMRKDIDTSLKGLPTPGWEVVWGPGIGLDRGNMLYVAGNSTTNQYAVAVRGTDWSFWLDWLEDFASMLPLVPFAYVLPRSSNPPLIRIALGTSLGLDELIAIQGADASGTNSTLGQFLATLPATSDIFVTGHSLGGCLASVVAAWAAHALGGAARVKAYTFAAPSAGDSGFASYYNALFTDATSGLSTAFRVYNTLDFVPNAWASLAHVDTYYQPKPLAPEDIKLLVSEAIKIVGAEYVQVGTKAAGSEHPLPGQVIPWNSFIGNLDPTGNVEYAHQVGEQHATATYMRLLAAQPHMAATVKLSAMSARRRGQYGG